MSIMKKKSGNVIFFKENKVKRGKRVQRKSFFNKIKGKCCLYNFIVILSHASESSFIKYVFFIFIFILKYFNIFIINEIKNSSIKIYPIILIY